ncbi:hypothetical protein C2845_PM15G04040 [Panicum miliaceum]|uniref:Uncharacterized protein n=1 Tax=Panicum miliaceum TaxID=4540 RepID=A0A3L6Q3L9_PANMI|nr:hypothetical protein C2845_PM15G04040 [Panicum miliaceum]
MVQMPQPPSQKIDQATKDQTPEPVKVATAGSPPKKGTNHPKENGKGATERQLSVLFIDPQMFSAAVIDEDSDHV